jgi:peptidoglycan/LPS O-acetylase OafA/YrhL
MADTPGICPVAPSLGEEKLSAIRSPELSLFRGHIPALDGLRFLAALLVLLGHGYGYVVGSPEPPNLVHLTLLHLVILGMTMFFVLSGFVIHLNYHASVGNGWSGTYDFFVARFARLYPLFLAVFGFEFFRLLYWQAPQHGFTMLWPLPFYLTFTQTWFFIPIDGHPLFAHYTYFSGAIQATGAMWSLSIEFLFYAAYPWLARPISRLCGRSLYWLFLAVVFVEIGYFSSLHLLDLHQFSRLIFPSPDLANSFVIWVTFYSPAVRMMEFLLGALAAQAFLSQASPGKSHARGWAAPGIAICIAAWCCLSIRLHFETFGPVIVAAPVAVLILLSAQGGSWFSRCLGCQTLVRAGEASYSIYLLHWYIMALWGGFYAASLPPRERLTVYVVGIIATIGISRFSYLIFERPAQRWLRRKLRSRLGRGLIIFEADAD